MTNNGHVLYSPILASVAMGWDFLKIRENGRGRGLKMAQNAGGNQVSRFKVFREGFLLLISSPSKQFQFENRSLC